MRVIFAVALVAVVLTHSTVEAQADGDEAPAAAVKQSGYSADEHRMAVEQAGQAEAKMQVSAAKKIISDAQKKAAEIVQEAKSRAAAITGGAKDSAKLATGQAVEVVNEKAHALLAKAKKIEEDAVANGEKARAAALTAENAKVDSKNRAERAKANLDKAKVIKTFARAKAAEDAEIAQKKSVSAASAKALAQKELETAKETKDALKQEVAKERELAADDKAMAKKLKQTQAEAEADRARARKMVEKAEEAKAQVKRAAKDAIRKAVKNAAILASVEKKKADEAMSNERTGKDLGSANVLAAQAQTAAEEQVAKSDIRKAKEEMAKLAAAKKKALSQVHKAAEKEHEKEESGKASPTALMNAQKTIDSLKDQLKESNSDTAGETLLSAMYNALPYEQACGSLASDPAKMGSPSAKDKGACAAHCAAKVACKSFQFQGSTCTLSKKVILKQSEYGQMMACATKNVLVKPSMRPEGSVFQKKPDEEDEDMGESIDLIELAEDSTHPVPKPDTYWAAKLKGVQGELETCVAKSRKLTKVAAPKPGSKEAEDEAQERIEAEAPGREPPKLEAAKIDIPNMANIPTMANPMGAGAGAAGKAPVDLNDESVQNAIHAAVEKARAEAVKDKVLALAKAKSDAEDAAKDEIAKATGQDSELAKAKLAKGEKDEAIAKEALKKALTISDAEKDEIKQNKVLAKEVGKEKTDLLLAKKEKEAYQGELKEAEATDKAALDKEKSKVEALESQEIKDSAKKAEAQESAADEKAVRKRLVDAAKEMAVGMRIKENEIEALEKAIEKHNAKHKRSRISMRKLRTKIKKADIKFKSAQKKCQKSMSKARSSYEKSINSVQAKLNAHLTQAELAKRALQLCEMKTRGAGGRAAERVARRENRAMKRAKRIAGEKDAAAQLKKDLKANIEEKLASKMKEEEAKAIAEKVKKLTGKKLSPKCQACTKLTNEEKAMIGADCKAC